MLYEAEPGDIASIVSNVARISAERDAAVADAKRAREERDGWAAKYDALVREILHARERPITEPPNLCQK